MRQLTLDELLIATGGKLIKKMNDIGVDSAAIDSRLIKKNGVFFAIIGEKEDGHKYIDSAQKNGACVAVVQKLVDVEINQILVEDSLKALQSLAKYYRKKFSIPIVAITGSSGKTSTKDVVAGVLSQKFKVLKTQGNLNSITGLPLSVLELDETYEAAVFEVGMDRVGEIKTLCDVLLPSIAAITNIGYVHAEYIGSREKIFFEKSQILSNLTKGQTGIVNYDDDLLRTVKSDTYNLVTYGLDEGANVKANILSQGGFGSIFEVEYKNEVERFSFRYPGKHHIENCLCAIAIANLFSIDAAKIQKGFDTFLPSTDRMDIETSKNGFYTVINDCYNANPDSMKAAINTLKEMGQGRRKVVIMGDMYELGDKSEKLHFDCGTHAIEQGIDVVVTVGKLTKKAYEGALSLSSNSKHNKEIYYFSSKDELLENLDRIIKYEDIILVKGSRGMHLETVVSEIIGR